MKKKDLGPTIKYWVKYLHIFLSGLKKCIAMYTTTLLFLAAQTDGGEPGHSTEGGREHCFTNGAMELIDRV